MGLEVTLLIIGAIILVASFIFSSKADGPEVRAELSEKQREDIKNQVISVFDEQADSLKEKTEADFDKLAVEKMNEMTEYSETILGEINRNHNEVMFLYDMLNEKKKEINSTVRDLNSVKKEITETTRGTGKPATAPDNISDEEKADGAQGENAASAEKTVRKAPVKTQKEKVLDQLDAVADTVADDVDADMAAEPKTKTRRRTSNAKNAAERARNTVKKETEREANADVTVFENGNNNEKILELSRQGKSNVEIAKALGLGIGEVKLVVDLFKGGK